MSVDPRVEATAREANETRRAQVLRIPGVVHASHARSTGMLVSLRRIQDVAGEWLPPVLCCEEHGSKRVYRSLELARYFMGHPESWCLACADLSAGDPVPAECKP